MLSSQGFNVVSDEEAIHFVRKSSGNFVAFLGAGASVEAGVPVAAGICQELAADCVSEEEKNRHLKGGPKRPLTDAERVNFLAQRLRWEDKENRYYNCVTGVLPSPVSRVAYFRGKLGGVKPSFSHYATSQLMAGGCLSRTAVTTNFDKLLENAFAEIGQSECQAIRMLDEVQYWRQETDKCYLLKLHGDYDTHNILNTEDETVALDPEMVAKAGNLLTNAGMVVLGSAGSESSISGFMETLATDTSKKTGVLAYGLLWAVYVGPGQPIHLQPQQLVEIVERQIANGAVGPRIVKLMKRRAKDGPTFAFFPIWGCGSFLWSLMHHTLPPQSITEAEQYLDHDLRIGEVFRRKGLSEIARVRHIKALETAQQKHKLHGIPSPPHEYVLQAKTIDSITRVLLTYGDISDDRLLGDPKVAGSVKAIVTPEDTCLSVGGGVALAVAHKAGLRRLLHDVYKFAPIEQGRTAVTSGGRLKVHYLIHAASVEVTETGASTTDTMVKNTVADVLRRVSSLGVDVVWIPLLGAGVAGMTAQQSAEAIADAINDWLPIEYPCTVAITVFKESLLPRQDMSNILQARLTKKSIEIVPM
jgi:O-acetyl-ADP-ribose deacetylase (regulator of RNase III)